MERSLEREPVTLWAFQGLYMFLLGLALVHHEPWRDEIQAWLLARDSSTLGELWRNTRYEGHPLLWHVALWVVTRFFQHPVAMQALHWIVASAAAWVFLRYAPFGFWVRVGWVFGYFPFYEYGVISRNYGLTLLFLLLALKWSTHPTGASISLALASNSSPMGVLLVPPLALALKAKWKGAGVKSWILLAVGWGIALWSCIPPADYEHARGFFLGWEPFRAYYILRGLAFSLLTLLRYDLHFWNNTLLFPFDFAGAPFAFPLAIAVAAGMAALLATALWSSRRLTLIWSLGLLILVSFFYVKFPGAARHHGFILVWSVLCLWLARDLETSLRSSGHLFLALSLAAGLQGSLVATLVDWRHPFSAGKDAARSVSLHCKGAPLVGHTDWAASTVAGFLPGQPVYYLTTKSYGSYVVWNLARVRREFLSEQEIVAEALNLGTSGETCLLLNRPLSEQIPCRLLAAFPEAIVGDEAFWLYRCGTPAP